jgi:hypothetical protein
LDSASPGTIGVNSNPSSSKVVMTMATMAAAANVISLETHPAWRSSSRRSAALLAAKRRHPSYQDAQQEPREHHGDAVVIDFRRR